MEIVEHATDKHWGSYDAVDHGFDARQSSPLAPGALERQLQQAYGGSVLPYEGGPAPGQDLAAPAYLQGVGQAPAGPLWVADRGIRVVRPEVVGPLMQTLALYAPPPPSSALVHEFTVLPTTQATGWADALVAQGYVLLVDVMSPPRPDGGRTLATIRGQGGTSYSEASRAMMEMAGVDQPGRYALLAYKGDVPAQSVCPSGQVLVNGQCRLAGGVEPSGGGGVAPAPSGGWWAQRSTTEKAAVVGVGLLAGALVVGGLASR